MRMQRVSMGTKSPSRRLNGKKNSKGLYFKLGQMEDKHFPLSCTLPLETMKSSRKLKIAIVLSISILINVFLIWEVFRLRAENHLLSKKESIKRPEK